MSPQHSPFGGPSTGAVVGQLAPAGGLELTVATGPLTLTLVAASDDAALRDDVQTPPTARASTRASTCVDDDETIRGGDEQG